VVRCAAACRPTRPGSTASAEGDAVRYLIDEAQQRADAGFSAIKLKLGFGIDEDIRLCQSIRQAIGETMTIMVDANHAYDATAAIRVGRQIEELDIAWFEEPVPPEDLHGYRQVKPARHIPIAGGEAEFTRWGFRPILVDRTIDILQPDVCAAGGLSECKKIADMASAFGVRVNRHVGRRRPGGFVAFDRDLCRITRLASIRLLRYSSSISPSIRCGWRF
jgi:D-galactarolactone cycloisomerase